MVQPVTVLSASGGRWAAGSAQSTPQTASERRCRCRYFVISLCLTFRHTPVPLLDPDSGSDSHPFALFRSNGHCSVTVQCRAFHSAKFVAVVPGWPLTFHLSLSKSLPASCLVSSFAHHTGSPTWGEKQHRTIRFAFFRFPRPRAPAEWPLAGFLFTIGAYTAALACLRLCRRRGVG